MTNTKNMRTIIKHLEDIENLYHDEEIIAIMEKVYLLLQSLFLDLASRARELKYNTSTYNIMPIPQTKKEILDMLSNIEKYYNKRLIEEIDKLGGPLEYGYLSYEERGLEYWKWYHKENAIQHAIANIKGITL